MSRSDLTSWVCTLFTACIFISLIGCGDSSDPIVISPGEDTVGGEGEDVDTPPEDTTAADVTEDTTEPPPEDTTVIEEDIQTNGCPVGIKSCLDKNGLNDPSLCADQPDTICTGGCCTPVFKCANDNDCADFAGDADMGCHDERFDCACNVEDGSCYLFICNDSDDCLEGEYCYDGVCEDNPDPTKIVARITSGPTSLTSGTSVQLYAEAYNIAFPATVIPNIEIEWASTNSVSVSIDSETGVVTGTDVPGIAEITAHAKTESTLWSESLFVTNYGPASDGAFRVIAVNGGDHSPVATGTVVLATGEEGGTTTHELTDGVMEASDISGPVDVHLFSSDHHFVSVYGFEGNDLLLIAQAKQHVELDIEADGTIDPANQIFEGSGDVITGSPKFEYYHKQGEIEAGITGLGIGAGLLSFDLPQLVGPNVNRYWDPEAPSGMFDPDEQQELPGGVTFGIGFPVVSTYWLAGGAGEHRMWSLGGRVALSDEGVGLKLSQIIDSVSSGDDLDVTEIISTLLPLFGDFYSGISTVELDDEPDFTAPVTEDVVLKLPLQNHVDVSIPSLPTLGAEDMWTDAVLVMGGSLDAQHRFIPLGITAGTDASETGDVEDGLVDGDPLTPGVMDSLALPMAAAHSGIQGGGSSHAVVAIAAVLGDTGGEKPEAGSGKIALIDVPAAGPNPYAELDMSETPFLPISIGTAWNEDGERVLSLQPVSDSDFHRVIFRAEDHWEWHVYLPEGVDTVTLPDPTTFDENLGDPAAGAQRYVVNAFDLVSEWTLEDLLTPGGFTLEGLLTVVERASYINEKPVPAE